MFSHNIPLMKITDSDKSVFKRASHEVRCKDLNAGAKEAGSKPQQIFLIMKTKAKRETPNDKMDGCKQMFEEKTGKKVYL